MPRPNDRFKLSESTMRSSKTTINIAGIHVYLYGVDELTPEQAKDTTVVFHIHGRTRTYKDAEEFAHQVLYETRERGGANKKGIVIATFDNRNHGTRAIDDIAIQDWKGGNIKHGQDMLSTMDGIVVDVQTVMKFMEAYVDGIFTPTQFIATGVSLGGHVTWNLLAEDPRIEIAIPIIGSPNLTDLLLDRLGGYTKASDVPEGTKEWPRSIEKLYQARDDSLTKISGKNILILNGAEDPLVPSRFTHPWMEKYAANNSVKFIEQDGVGHCLSEQMIDNIVDWLLPLLT